MLNNSSKHQIQKFTFDVGFDSEESASQFQADFSAFIKEEILPLTESILSEYGNNKYIRINRLELDLGDIFQESYKEAFYRKFKEKLSDKLRLILSGYNINSPDENPEIVSLAKSQYHTLLYFFQTGLLPWNAREPDTSSYINKQVSEFIESSPAKIKQLVKDIFIFSSYRLRFIRQIEEEILWRVIRLYYESDIESIKKEVYEVIEFYSKNNFSSLTLSEFKETVLEFIMEELVQKKNKKSYEKIFSVSLLKFIANKAGINIESLIIQLFSLTGLKAESVKGKIVVDEKIQNKGKSLVDSPIITLVKRIIESGEFEAQKIVNQTTIKDATAEFFLDGKDAGKVNIVENKKAPARSASEQQSYLSTLQLQNISVLLSLLKKYYGTSVQYREGYRIPGFEVKDLERHLNDIINFNPSLLRRIFGDGLFDIEEYSNQQILLELNPTIRTAILQQAFSKDEEAFLRLIKTTEEKYIKEFLSYGIINAALVQKYSAKKQLTAVMESYLKQKLNSSEIKKIIKGLSEEAIIRLINQWRKYVEVDKIKKYFKEFESAFEVNRKEQMKAMDAYLSSINLEALSFESVLTLLQEVSGGKRISVKELKEIGKLIKELFSKNESKALLYFASLDDKKYALIKPLLSEELVTKTETSRKVWKQGQENLIAEKKKVEEIAEKIKEIGIEQEQQKEEEEKKPPIVKTGEPVYINNSGIVILHPYLSMLFKKMELMDKKEFKDEYSMHKAVHVLQYLANKSEKTEEHELVLNKIMCGMDLSIPLQRDIELSENEKALCESLLEALIQNWTILKKTSPDNLRSSFFIREGRLLLEPQGWKLRVEEKGYDILVEKLPWSIAMVKLPWMKDIIYVEWK